VRVREVCDRTRDRVQQKRHDHERARAIADWVREGGDLYANGVANGALIARCAVDCVCDGDTDAPLAPTTPSPSTFSYDELVKSLTGLKVNTRASACVCAVCDVLLISA
jgi:hypothetical protein